MCEYRDTWACNHRCRGQKNPYHFAMLFLSRQRHLACNHNYFQGINSYIHTALTPPRPPSSAPPPPSSTLAPSQQPSPSPWPSRSALPTWTTFGTNSWPDALSFPWSSSPVQRPPLRQHRPSFPRSWHAQRPPGRAAGSTDQISWGMQTAASRKACGRALGRRLQSGTRARRTWS